jgi:hypothetical protein
MDVTMSGFAEWNDSRVEAMHQRAKGDEVKFSRASQVQTIIHAHWFTKSTDADSMLVIGRISRFQRRSTGTGEEIRWQQRTSSGTLRNPAQFAVANTPWLILV